MTETGHYDRIYGLLVEQSGVLGGVSQDIKALRKDFDHSEQLSADSRAKMLVSVDTISSRLKDIERRVGEAEGHIMLANAFIARRERFEARMGGWLAAFSWMGARAWTAIGAAIAFVVAYREEIWTLIKSYLP